MTTALLALSLAAGCTSNPQPHLTSYGKMSSAIVVDEGAVPSTPGAAPSTSPATVPITVAGTEGTTTTTAGDSPVVPTGGTVGVPSTTSPGADAGRKPSGSQDHPTPGAQVVETLACIRSYEQGAAGYQTNTGNGHFGAYQFAQSTWDGAVARAGYPEWSGRRASDAPPHVQDAAAAQLLSERGLQPWPTPNRLCG